MVALQLKNAPLPSVQNYLLLLKQLTVRIVEIWGASGANGTRKRCKVGTEIASCYALDTNHANNDKLFPTGVVPVVAL